MPQMIQQINPGKYFFYNERIEIPKVYNTYLFGIYCIGFVNIQTS